MFALFVTELCGRMDKVGGFKLEIFILSQKGLESTTCGLGLASFIVVTSIFEIEVFDTKWYF